MKLEKLVRDRVIEHIKMEGKLPIFHVADQEEYWNKLKEKLIEECQEFVESENIEEIADVLEVIDTIIEFKNFKQKNIIKIKDEKSKERGKFKKKIILSKIL